MDEFSNKVANVFKSHGYKKGDVVALFLENKPEFICIWLGLSKLGVITPLINTNQRLNSLVHSINIAKSQAVIFGTELSEGTFMSSQDSLSVINCFCSCCRCTGQDRIEGGAVPDQLQQQQHPSNQPKIRKPRSVDQRCASNGAPNNRKGGSPRSPGVHLHVGHHRPAESGRYHHLPLRLHSGRHPLAEQVQRQRQILHAPTFVPHGWRLHDGGSDVDFRLDHHHPQEVFGFHVLFGLHQVQRYGTTPDFQLHLIVNPRFVLQIAQYIGEMCRYILAVKPKPTDTQHKLRMIYGNGLRPQIWSEFVERFNIPKVAEFYGATEGNANIGNAAL